MNPDKLIDLVKSLFPDVGVFYSPADPEFPSSIPVVQFSAFDNAVTIDISDSLYSIYDYDVNDFDREVYISFNDPLHVLPYIYLWLDSGKAEPELPQYDQFRSAIVNHHLRLSVDDFVVWPCGTWCYRSELPQMIHKSDDFEIIPAFSDDWHEFIPELLVPSQVKTDGGHSS